MTNKNIKQTKGYSLENKLKKEYGSKSIKADINYKKALTKQAKKDKDTKLTQARIDLLKAQTDKAKNPSFQKQQYDDTLKGKLKQAMSKNLASHGKMIDVPMTDKERAKIGKNNKILPSKDDYISDMIKEIKDYYDIGGVFEPVEKRKQKASMRRDIKALQINSDTAYNSFIKARLNDPNSEIPTTKKVRKPYTVPEIKRILKPSTISELIGVVEGMNDVAKDKTLLELNALKKSLKAKKAGDKEVEKMQELHIKLLNLAKGDRDKYDEFKDILEGKK